MMNKKYITLILMILAISIALPAKVLENQIFMGIRSSGTKLIGGKVDDSSVRLLGEINFGYYFTRRLALYLEGGYGFVTVRDKDQRLEVASHIVESSEAPYKTTFIPVSLGVRYNLRKDKTWIPYVSASAGMIKWESTNTDSSKTIDSDTNLLGSVALGIEWEVSRHFGMNFGVKYQNIFNQRGDMSGLSELQRPDVQSGNISVGLGFTIRFGGYKDSDGDGFANNKDQCPFTPEDFDDFEDEDGCPDLDNDKDALPDSVETNTGVFVDAQNTGTDPNSNDTDMDGLDDYDEITKYHTNPVSIDSDDDKLTDGDEINNYKTDPMSMDTDSDGANDYDEINIHQTNPLSGDTDGDGILDGKDQCPVQAETFNGYKDSDGCPDKKPEIIFKKKAPIILDGINFKLGSAELTRDSEDVIMKVVQTMKDYPTMQLEISGHSDNTGSRAYNLKLSKDRAQSVKDFLVGKGIDANRAWAIGLGPDHPIASNNTEEGRAKNRRIEFFRKQ